MLKDWRTAICMRWGLPTVLLLIAIGWIALSFISKRLDGIPVRRLEKKAETLAVGMTEADLLKIMGRPAAKNYKVDPKALNLGEGDPVNIVEYIYSARNSFSDSGISIGGIFVDAGSSRIVSVRLSPIGHLPDAGLYGVFIGALMILIAVVIWLPFRFWCENNVEKEDP